MAKETILQAIWRINRKLPVILMVLIVGNLLFFLFLTQYLEPEISLLERRFISQQSEVREAEQGGRSAESPLVIYARGIKDLQAFRKAIPSKSDLTGLVGEVFNLAESSGLVIDRISYDPNQMEELALLQYGLNFVVSGNYNQIKKFTHKIEQSKRILSIDQMKLNQGTKEKDIRLSLELTTYFKADEA